MFNEINEGGLNRILSQRLGMKGSSAAPACAPELFPGLTLENDRPEWGFLKGELLASKQVFVAAVAAQFAQAQLYLPSTSNLIVTVESIVNLTANVANVARGVGIGGGLGGWSAATVGTRDFRWNGERTGAVHETRSGAANPTTFPNIAQLASNGIEIKTPIVIVPGTALCIFNTTLNQTMSFTIAWRERVALPGELV